MAEQSSVSGSSSSSGNGFQLDPGLSEAIRLDYQHFLWRESLGFNIHPSIPKSQIRSVADICTGTGAWLCDIAEELPYEAMLEGFNIDPCNTPPPAWAPRNVSFDRWNIFDEPPSGTYDLVHVRLMAFMFDSGEAALPIIRKMMRLLRPGGYLQWDEIDNGSVCVRKVDPGIPTPALDRLEAKSKSDEQHNWCINLPQYIESVGLRDIVATKYSYQRNTTRWLTRPIGDQGLMFMSNYAKCLEMNGDTEAARDFEKLVSQAYQESLKGAAMVYPRLVVIARK